MAYTNKFIFTFDSHQGKECQIIIAEDGYSGTAVDRAVGGSPILRMDQNGSIRGTSLEFPAECVVADEFADLYTSNPLKFRVTLSINGATYWRGFITPELYAAPWVDPPHDVTVTATDGLGELKNSLFNAAGRISLSSHLTTLLAATGLSLDIRFISKMNSNISDADYLLPETFVNLDHMAGQKKYDVLQAILTFLHATIRQHNGVWLLVREVDVVDCEVQGDVLDQYGDLYPIYSFGSMGFHSIWPVGKLDSEIVPARSRQKITSTAEVGSGLLADPDFTANDWSGDATYKSTLQAYEMAAGKYIYKNVSFPEIDETSLQPNLRLTIKATHLDTANDHNVKVRVKAYGKNQASPSTYKTYYLREQDGSFFWDDSAERYVSLDLGKGPSAYTVSEENAKTVALDIPFRTLMSDYLDWSSSSYMEIRVEADDNTLTVFHAGLDAMPLYSGFETTVVLGNGARGLADDVDCTVADTAGYTLGLSFMGNAAFGYHGGTYYLLHYFWSDRITTHTHTLGEFLGLDYAHSVANPRLRLKGKLNIPAAFTPAVFYDNSDITFIAEEWSYDLINDELDISMISLPAVSISVTSIDTERIDPGQEGSSGGSGGGGGGGGGATSLAALTDVDLTTTPPSDGSLLMYDGTTQMWIPGSSSGGGGKVFYGTCPTALATAEKAVTATGFTASDLVEGTVLHVLFTNANSASTCSLNVNSTGATSVSHSQTVQYMWSNNTIGSFVYQNGTWRLFGNFAYTNRYGKVMLVTTVSGLLTNKAVQNHLAITPNLGWQLFLKSLRAPEVTIIHGNDNSYQHIPVEMFKISHPLAESSQISAEVVLMMYSKRRRTRVRAGAPQEDALYKRKDKWGVSRGSLATNEPLIAHYTGVDRAWYLTLDEVRIHIIQNYVKTGNGGSFTPPGVLNAFKNSGTGPHFGYGTHKKRGRLFGFALRFQNPEFVATQGIRETTGNDSSNHPRYIYSEVYPVKVWINVWSGPPDYTSYNVMGFQLNPFKGG